MGNRGLRYTEDAIKLVKDGQADCFVTGISSEGNYSKKYGFYSVPLPNPANSCFAVNSGNRSLLSILNKTINNASQYAYQLSGDV